MPTHTKINSFTVHTSALQIDERLMHTRYHTSNGKG